MSRQIAKRREGEDCYKYEPINYEIRKLLDDLFSWSGEYGARMDNPTHQLAREKLGELMEEMLETGLVDSSELVGQCEGSDLGSVLAYLKGLLLVENSRLILDKRDLIKVRVMTALFPKSMNGVAGEDDEVMDELMDEITGAAINFQVDDTDVAAKLLEKLLAIAYEMPSAEYLSKLARASYVSSSRR